MITVGVNDLPKQNRDETVVPTWLNNIKNNDSDMVE